MEEGHLVQWEFFQEPFVVCDNHTLPRFRDVFPGEQLMWKQDAIHLNRAFR
jgi:hypothetical protein